MGALFLLVTYYFLVVNPGEESGVTAPEDSLKAIEVEKRKADAALISKVKSAISQTKRLHGYNIGVECREGTVTLNGEVLTEIDKELAVSLARETNGVKDVNNQIRVVPQSTPQAVESRPQDPTSTVDDLELQANVRERLISVSELKDQAIEVKVQNRVVTLRGSVASEALKLRAEQIVRDSPKVTTVNNELSTISSSPKANPTT